MKYQIEMNGRTYEVEVELAEPMTLTEFAEYAPAAPAAEAAPVQNDAPAAAPAPAAAAAVAEGETINAPMPGNILKVNVTAGQTVKSGTVLVVLEAMKMENEILAPRDCTVKQVVATKGSTVDTGAVLVVLA